MLITKYSLWFLAGTVLGLVHGGNRLLAQMGQGEAETSFAMLNLLLAALPYSLLGLAACYVIRKGLKRRAAP